MKGEAFAPVPNRGMITNSIMLANIMQGVDNTILNVALPHIQGSLLASLDQIAWALTSYIACAAIICRSTLIQICGIYDRPRAINHKSWPGKVNI